MFSTGTNAAQVSSPAHHSISAGSAALPRIAPYDITSSGSLAVVPTSGSPASYLSDAEYSFVFSRTPRPCVDLLIESSRGILFGWRTEGSYLNTWALPGGRIRMRESIPEALSRVALRELGQIVISNTCIGYAEFLAEVEHGEPRHSISLVHKVEVAADALSEAILREKNLRWFSRIPEDAHPIHARFLQEKGFLNENLA